MIMQSNFIKINLKFVEELKKVIDNPIVNGAKVIITIQLKKSKQRLLF